MKKIIGIALVSTLLGMAPLVALAQAEKGTDPGTMKPMTTEQKTTTDTSAEKKNEQVAPKTTLHETTTEKTSEKKVEPATPSAAKEETTTEKVVTKKPVTEATHPVKSGQSAVLEKKEEKKVETKEETKEESKKEHASNCEMKKKTSTTTHHKATQHKAATPVKTGQSAVKQAPPATPAKKTTNKVEQSFKHAGNVIHQDWEKMTHPKK